MEKSDQYREFSKLYSHIDLTFLHKDFVGLNYIYDQYKTKKYHSLVCRQQLLNQAIKLGFNNITLLTGWPFDQNFYRPTALEFKKIDWIELGLDANKIKNLSKLYSELREEIYLAHSQGVRVRIAAELTQMPEQLLNDYLEVLNSCQIDGISTGLGFEQYNLKVISELKRVLPEKITIKTVGSIETLAQVKEIVEAGATYVAALNLS